MDVPLESLEISIIGKTLRKRGLISADYLEVGCGDGFNLERFSRWGMKGAGVDLSAKALSVARAKQLDHVVLFEGDFLTVKNSFAPRIIFMLNILEHVHDDQRVMQKAAGLLPHDGFLVIAVPANPRAYGFADANAGHVRRYEEHDLRKKLAAAGFDIAEWYCVGFPVNRFYTWVFNLLNRRRAQDLDESQTIHSGIRHDDAYYGGFFDAIARIAYPILRFFIRIDLLFLYTDLGNNFVVFAQKR